MVPRIDIVKAEPDYRLWLRFSDGVEGVVDLSADLWGPAFEELKDQHLFASASVDPDFGTVVWPNGADFAPEELYRRLKQQPSFA